MKLANPALIPESVDRAINGTCPNLDTEGLISYLALIEKSHNLQSPVFYLADYRNGKYFHIDASSITLRDRCVNGVVNAGHLFYTDLCNRNDLKIFDEKIFPETVKFLKSQPLDEYPQFSFSFNYRISNTEGKWKAVLQRAIYLKAADDGLPLTAIVFVTDISQYKEDSRIVFTIEKGNTDRETLTNKPLLKSIYYPDSELNVLSKREVEILKLIYQGLSSKKIADTLFVSKNTINNHRKKMLEKTKVKNTSELLGYALKKGLLAE